ncbi:MAG: hypothetical protein MZV63_02950 [Marinilabiliales bacterium]|nr:hypothetical protein [Marinilabiliales bacterium]
MIIANRSLADLGDDPSDTYQLYPLLHRNGHVCPEPLGAVIVGAQPFVTAIVSRIMIKDERFTRAKVFTIVSWTGRYCACQCRDGRSFTSVGPAELAGIVMIFMANISTATSNVLVSKNGKR